MQSFINFKVQQFLVPSWNCLASSVVLVFIMWNARDERDTSFVGLRIFKGHNIAVIVRANINRTLLVDLEDQER